MPKINILDHLTNENSWTGFFLNELISQNFDQFNEKRTPEHEIVVTIGGIEYDPVEVFEFIGSCFDEEVKKEAAKLVKKKIEASFFNKYEELGSKFEHLKEELNEQIDSIIFKESGDSHGK